MWNSSVTQFLMYQFLKCHQFDPVQNYSFTLISTHAYHARILTGSADEFLKSKNDVLLNDGITAILQKNIIS